MGCGKLQLAYQRHRYDVGRHCVNKLRRAKSVQARPSGKGTSPASARLTAQGRFPTTSNNSWTKILQSVFCHLHLSLDNLSTTLSYRQLKAPSSESLIACNNPLESFFSLGDGVRVACLDRLRFPAIFDRASRL